MLSKTMLLPIAVCWALSACNITKNHSATDAPVRVVEKPVLPPVPSALMQKPPRPEPPASGKAADLLAHAADFGAYVRQLEIKLDGWIQWAQEQAESENEP